MAQTAWNIDVLDGTGESGVTLDPTKGNVYGIRFQWLGYGAMTFYVENPASGKLIPVHRIAYANANTKPSTRNPSFPIYFAVNNTYDGGTNNTDLALKTASCACFIEGRGMSIGPTHGTVTHKTLSDSNYTNVSTIKNVSTFNSRTNLVVCQLLFLQGNDDQTESKPTHFKLVRNTTLGGTPSYTSYNASHSVIQYDTAGTTVTGGDDILTFCGGGSSINVRDLDITLNPGDTLTLAAKRTAGSNTDVSGGLTWMEDL